MTQAEEDDDGPRGESKSSPRAMAITLVLLSLLGSTLLGELILRLVWENPYRNETTDYLIKLQINYPQRDFRIDRRSVYPDRPVSRLRTDERSYVLPSRRFDEPDATVAFLGASTTQNAAVSENLRFHAVVSELLEEKGLRVNTLNAASPGISTQDSLNVLLNHVVFDDPDVVVMMHAHADIGRLTRDGEYAPQRSGNLGIGIVTRWLLQRASIESSLVAAARWWQAYRPIEPQIYERADKKQVVLPTEKFVARLKAFIGICRAFDMVPVLMTQPVINIQTPLTPDWTDIHNQEIFNHLIRKVGEEEGVVVIDLVKYLFDEVEDWNEPMVVFYDGVHVNDYGSERLGEHIAERLYESVLKPGLDSLRNRPAQQRRLPADTSGE